MSKGSIVQSLFMLYFGNFGVVVQATHNYKTKMTVLKVGRKHLTIVKT